MQYIANRLTCMLEKRGVIPHASREVYVYGLDVMLYTYLSTTALFLIGLLAKRPLETVILISLFYANQTLGGGFHAKTHLKCFLTMLLGLVFYLFSFLLPLAASPLVLIAVMSLSILYFHPLTLHKNKLYLSHKAEDFIKKARLALCIEFLAFLFSLLVYNVAMLHSISVSLGLCACSRLVAIKLRQGKAFY